MQFFSDLHIHSRYSRATSADMSPENIWRWAQLKGVSVIGTGDFTHPEWFRELKEKTGSAGNGFFRLKKKFTVDGIPDSCRSEVFFLLSAEISCIYKKNGRTRKIHSLIFVPDFADAERINRALAKIGNLTSDGRPILGLDAAKLLEIVKEASPAGALVPAHAWTPHFSVFGAASGFDCLEECFGEMTPEIFAIETGLSSDPAMNRRLSALDGVTLISNSDAHSPGKIGREANIFDTDLSYPALIGAMKTGRGLRATIEFFPEEGKYHYDGHRSCGVSLTPRESLGYSNLCPVCGKKLTIGVLHRVEELADRGEESMPPGAPPFHSVIPLTEVIGEVLKVGAGSKTVERTYFALLEKLGSEFSILLDARPGDIEAAGFPVLGDAISKVRAGDVRIEAGFDGEYGRIRIFEAVRKRDFKGRRLLF